MRKLFSWLKRLLSTVCIFLAKGLIRLFIRPKVCYTSPAARTALRDGPHVIITNHASLLDIPVVITALGGSLHPLMAKDMLEKHAALRLLLAAYPVIPVDRQQASLGWLRDCRKALREGHSVVIAPEGRIHPSRVVGAFKPGAVLLAATAGVSIIPAYHNATFHWLLGKRWRILVGEPFLLQPPPDGLQPEALQHQAEELHDLVNHLELQLNGSIRRSDTQH